MSDELLEAVLACVGDDGASPPTDIVHRDQHSNDFAEVRLRNGRSLIVKRARYDWAEPRFRASRVASRMIRQETMVAVPAPLPVPAELDARPLEAYWRIELPTLEEILPRLDDRSRPRALRSWGELASRLHAVRVDGFGPVGDPATAGRPLDRYLREELAERLLPAITDKWPAAVSTVHRMVRVIDEVAERVGGRSRLVHNDLHAGNVLCEIDDGGEVRCVGLIDLETALGAPREADLAIMEVQHSGLFGDSIPGPWLRDVYAAYSEQVDPWVVHFYRAFHQVNMGFYSAIIGHHEHADQVAGAAAREVADLERRTASARMEAAASVA
ncbi:MAG: aminoglycoside phosphotransferase family protein [Gemmatimonadota bacterium]